MDSGYLEKFIAYRVKMRQRPAMRKIRKLFALLLRRDYRRALRLGSAAAIEHNSFLRNASFNTVLDAGANKGQFALVVRAHHGAATIISFEPLAGPADIWRRIFSGDSKARVFQVALGNQAGEKTIHISRREDSSSLLPIGKLQSDIFPGTEEICTEAILVERLDVSLQGENLARPVLLKIDVQGFEMELLKGAQATLAQVDSIYAELSFVALYEGQALANEVIHWLSNNGFGLSGVYNMAYDRRGLAVQADFHFRRSLP